MREQWLNTVTLEPSKIDLFWYMPSVEGLCHIVSENLFFSAFRMLPVYPFLSKEVLDGFKYKYKYSSQDTSPFSNWVMHPFWNRLVLIFPAWVAPNVMTFSGFLALTSQISLLAYIDPNFDAVNRNAIPNWVWLFCALCVFVAHQLDGIDGKQARRTKSSGPLGELFDHGIDSLSTFFLPVGLFSLFGHGEFGQTPLVFLLALYTIQLPFVLAQWEKYLTGILFLPWSYDIGMAGVATTYFITWYGGGATFWHLYVYGNYSMSTVLVAACSFSLALAIFCSLYNIYESYAKKTGRMIMSVYEALLPLFSPTVLIVAATYWALYSPGNVLVNNERWLLTLQGFIFSNIATRIIVSHMSLTRNQPVNAFVFLLVLGLGGIFGYSKIHGAHNPAVIAAEYNFLVGMTIFVVIGHLYYAYCVVCQMADHLNINVFSISKPNQK